MSSIKGRCFLDYNEGDIVQIRGDEHTGRVGRIERINLNNKRRDSFIYYVMIDGEIHVFVTPQLVRVRAAKDWL